MRRIGGVLFLFLLTTTLAACDKTGATQAVAAGSTTAPSTSTVPSTSTSTSPPTSAVPSTSTSSTSSTAAPTAAAPTTVARAATTVPTTAAPTVPAPTTTAVGASPPSGACDPNYAGACVPIDSDVDCSRTANGPSYIDAKNFRVIGKDIYKLDANGDGIACES